MQPRELAHADQPDAFPQVGFEEAARPPLLVERAARSTHVEGRMGPGGLGQVLDGDAEARLPFDEQHVAGLEAGHEAVRIGGCRHAMGVVRTGEIAAQPLADPARQGVEDSRHGPAQGRSRLSGHR